MISIDEFADFSHRVINQGQELAARLQQAEARVQELEAEVMRLKKVADDRK